MAELSIPNQLPPQFIVLSQDTIEAKDLLLQQAYDQRVLDVGDHVAATATAKAIEKLFKGVEAQRKEFGRELRELQSKVSEAADEALVPLKAAWEDLVRRIRSFEQAENARREADAARIRAETEARQRAENLRAEQAAQAAREEAALNEPFDVDVTPTEVSILDHLPERVRPTERIPQPIRSSAYRATGGKKVQVDNQDAVPFEINGVRLWKELNLTAIKALLTAGIPVPGCELVDNDGIAMKGI